MSKPSYHDKERLSASGTKRLEQCPSSYANALEAEAFREKYNITLEESEEAAAGTDNHTILAYASHYYSAAIAKGANKLDAKILYESVRQACGESKKPINVSDRIALFVMFERAQKTIVSAEEDIQKKHGKKVSSVEYDDYVRLAAKIRTDNGVHEFSGLPDIHRVIKTADATYHHIILDYKTGRASDKVDAPADNRQLLALTALATAKDPRDFTLERDEKTQKPDITLSKSAYVSIIGRNQDRSEKIQMARYGYDELKAARRIVLKTVRGVSDALTLEKKERASKEKAGSECAYCNGKVCCRTFQAKIKETIETKIKPLAEKLNEINDRKNSGDNTVDKQEYIQTLRELDGYKPIIALAEKCIKEANAYARGIASESPEEAAAFGITLKAGRKTIKVKENTDIATVIEQLKTKELLPSDFLTESVSEINAVRLREAVTGANKGWNTTNFMKKLQEAYGDGGVPFEMEEGTKAVVLVEPVYVERTPHQDAIENDNSIKP